jgi:hypothetical protein
MRRVRAATVIAALVLGARAVASVQVEPVARLGL